MSFLITQYLEKTYVYATNDVIVLIYKDSSIGYYFKKGIITLS